MRNLCVLEKKGFVKRRCLKKYSGKPAPPPPAQESSSVSSLSTADATDQARPAPHQSLALNEDAPAAAEAPPRYEDIFPGRPPQAAAGGQGGEGTFPRKEENIYEEIDQVWKRMMTTPLFNSH